MRSQTEHGSHLIQVSQAKKARGVLFGDVVYQPSGTYGPRIQPFYQLFILLEGSVRLTLDEKVITLIPNQMILLFPGHQEYFEFDQLTPSRHAWFHFPPELISPKFRKSLSPLKSVQKLPEQLMEWIHFALRHQTLGTLYDSTLHSLGLTCFHFLIDNLQRSQDSTLSPPHENLMKLEAKIRANLGHKWTLNSMADLMGVSIQHLNRLSKKYFQMSATEKLWLLRLEKARYLLGNTGWNLTEIAQVVGFETPFHLSRRFKQSYQITPSSYRAQLWGNL